MNFLKNPLININIGSRVDGFSNTFGLSVLKGKITKMISHEETKIVMSGSSNCVFTDRMNSGSLGLSGSYGVSGIRKIEAAVSGYTGLTEATDVKSVNINFNAFSLAGVEYIDFENLDVSEFLESLNKGCQSSALKVLNYYNQIVEEITKLNINLIEAFKDKNNKNLNELILLWVQASNDFTKKYGSGLVVGVVWGAFGGVSLNLQKKGTQKTWKHGEEVEFSYADINKSFALKGLYDHSETDKTDAVTVTCESFISGTILSEKINRWYEEVRAKGQEEIWNAHVRDLAPEMVIKQGAPKIPDFVAPNPSEDVIEQLQKFKDQDLVSLEDLAKIKGYYDAAENNKDLKIQEYLEKIKVKADSKNIQKMIDDISNNKIDVVPKENSNNLLQNKSLGEIKKIIKGTLLNTAITEESNQSNSPEGYVPLGAWISNWEDILPWLAKAYNNDTLDNSENVKVRVLIQDLQTLSKLYYLANSCGITELKRIDRKLQNIKTISLAESFANTVQKIQDYIKENNSKDFSGVFSIYKDMNTINKDIHEFWNDNYFLRNCELGLGLIKDYNKTIGEIKSSNSIYQTYKLENINFSGEDYSVFSKYLKVFPLITPDKEVIIFSHKNGVLTSIYNSEVNFSDYSKTKPITFTCDKGRNILHNQDLKIELYPIPFSAAKNISWKGQSMSTNIRVDGMLKKNLSNIKEELMDINKWTFSSSRWSKDWNIKDSYSQQNIMKYYIGLIDDIPNIF